jgi:predicted N-acetyltransferase YhbS
MITIRKEELGDQTDISLVHQRAFEQEAEAKLVERLRLSGVQQISLVAIFNNWSFLGVNGL